FTVFYYVFFFFFQAEDGIRDFHVTGVQTCALPISTAATKGSVATRSAIFRRTSNRSAFGCPAPINTDRAFSTSPSATPSTGSAKIGRASCRERVEVLGVAGSIE